MIINLKKILLFGTKNDINHFFEKVQVDGFLEFVSERKFVKKTNDIFKEILSAIKVLRKIKQVKQEDYSKLSTKNLSQNICHLYHVKLKLEEERRILQQEISKISPFGKFSNEDVLFLKEQAKRILQFFVINSKKTKKLKIPKDLIYITTQYDLDYFINITKEKKSFDKFTEIIVDTPLGALKEKVNLIDQQLIQIEKDLKDFAKYLNFLQKELVNSLNEKNLQDAKNDVKLEVDEKLFAIEAYIPENNFDKLYKLLEKFSISYEKIAFEKDEKIPTYLENKNFGKIGEDIIKVYDTPSTNDKDPSMWVLWAFAAFFSIIISDAGYGFIYLMLALFLKWKFKKPKPMIKRFTNLTLILSTCTIFWGICSGSFFGMGVNPKNPLDKITLLNFISEKKAEYHMRKKDDVYSYWHKKYPKVENAKDGKEFIILAAKVDNKKISYEVLDAFKNNILMELSLLLGSLHIICSFFRNVKRNIAGMGWVIFIIGGYLYFPKFVNATSSINFILNLPKNICFQYGLYFVFAGIVIAWILSFIQNKWKGIAEITNGIQVFADILSYLRLYALALAGMIMASTFNSIGTSMPIIFGIFALIIGHGINLLLSVMGGVIHGLRLNFLEWYNHCFEGGGKIFNPLRLFK